MFIHYTNTAQRSGEFESISEDLKRKKKLNKQFCMKTKCINGSYVSGYAFYISVSVHHKSTRIIYKKPTRCNSGSIVNLIFV